QHPQMPSLAAAELANAEYRPSYIPVAIFAGGTAGVGHAMAEALARYTKGRIHIIIIGRNEATATQILAGLTKPTGRDSGAWKHEFVKCDATEMKNVRVICAGLRARLDRINYLVLSAGANSLVWAGETSEGLDWHLSLRYYSRFVYIQELVPLLTAAANLGQDARVMTVLGAGFGWPINTKDINNSEARGSAYECLKGSTAGIRAMTISAGYNDAMVVWFAAQHPRLAFIHIHPGLVRTPEFMKGTDLGWALKPLAWVLHRLTFSFAAVSQVRSPASPLTGI
ncbi:NAD-P-binding protein, partial [Mycena epipterygia]